MSEKPRNSIRLKTTKYFRTENKIRRKRKNFFTRRFRSVVRLTNRFENEIFLDKKVQKTFRKRLISAIEDVHKNNLRIQMSVLMSNWWYVVSDFWSLTSKQIFFYQSERKKKIFFSGFYSIKISLWNFVDKIYREISTEDFQRTLFSTHFLLPIEVTDDLCKTNKVQEYFGNLVRHRRLSMRILYPKKRERVVETKIVFIEEKLDLRCQHRISKYVYFGVDFTRSTNFQGEKRKYFFIHSKFNRNLNHSSNSQRNFFQLDSIESMYLTFLTFIFIGQSSIKVPEWHYFFLHFTFFIRFSSRKICRNWIYP